MFRRAKGQLSRCIQAIWASADVEYRRRMCTLLHADSSAYASLLRQCGKTKGLLDGKCVHEQMTRSGHDRLTFLGNLLVQMYGKCGSIEDARSAFDRIYERNVFSWAIMIAAYAQNGHYREAVELYHGMDLEGVGPDMFIFSSVLGACSGLGAVAEGKDIHARISRSGLESDTVVQNALVNMYAKCGCLGDARSVFDRMQRKDVVSWNAMILAYAQHGHSAEALEIYRQMESAGDVVPDCITYVTAISACCTLADLSEGRSIHACVAARGYESDAVQNALINMYGKCNSLNEARTVFEKLCNRTSVSWNALIAAYAQHGHPAEVLELYHRMDLEGVEPSKVTFVSVIGACSTKETLAEVYARVISSGFASDVVVATTLVDTNARCGSLDGARRIFCSMCERNVFSWNAMVGAYVQHELSEEALDLFNEMDLEGVKPNDITFTVVLGACSSHGDLRKARQIHARVLCSGFNSSVVQNALINVYSKCGSLDEAKSTFDKMSQKTLVSWNAMIAAYIQNFQDEEALALFKQMQAEHVKPDVFTFASILGACSTLGALAEGSAVHAEVDASGITLDEVVGTALINIYGKCQDVDNASIVFDKVQQKQKSVVSWNAMIAAYAQSGHNLEALELFRRMDLEGIKPVNITYVSILGACSNLGILSKGEAVYSRIASNAFQTEEVGTSLVNMYSKCGSLERARIVFNRMQSRNPICWTAMFAAYSHHGRGQEAVELLHSMNLEGIQPNEINFTSILNACSHAGLRDEGWKIFLSMRSDHVITPAAEHFICMSDLLGRAGLLAEAEDLVTSLPFQPDVVAWKSLLNACKMHGNIERGASVAKKVVQLQPELSAPYVLLSNIYAAAGKWDEMGEVRSSMKAKHVKKEAGCSLIEVDHQVYEFVVGESELPRNNKIFSELEKLNKQMEEAGYIPDTAEVLHDVKEEEKQHMLRHHSEKLAIAFGLISTEPGATLRVVKNLRVCSDCHTAIKFITKIVGREIALRDTNRFHHFDNGLCSCGDYW